MKLSLNWAQYYSNVNLKQKGLNTLLKAIGEQLGAIENVVEWGKKYENILVVKVVECKQHENADKLSVCLIDDGGKVKNIDRNENGLIQVVCGAPNVRAGLTVAWIPPGTIVPSSFDKDPFTLGSRELRGVVSNGMLASAHELDISEDHDGILEIDPDEVGADLAKPGSLLKNLYGLDDVIIDLENKMFTHRPDCFGILGIARELAGIQNSKFVSPDWYLEDKKITNSDEIQLNVSVTDKQLIPRFTAIAMNNIRVDKSPIWLQSALTKVGIKPINNIVDLTNYYMYLTGQPLHAYDYDKVKSLSSNEATLIARRSNKGESIDLLNGKNIEFDDDSTIVISTDQKVIGIAGVMGGKETEVDTKTTSILIECANFDMYNIRKTSMKYGLFTDAVTRYNKGQSKLQNKVVISKIVDDIQNMIGGEVSSKLYDLFDDLESYKDIKLTSKFINDRLGSNLDNDRIISLLNNVEINCHIDNEYIIIKPPYWRTDLELPEDIVEEVGRLYGYHNLPVILPNRSTKPVIKNKDLILKENIINTLSSAGANEVYSYSFVSEKLLIDNCQDNKLAYQLSNAISPELQYYRLSLTPSLLEKVNPNIRAGHIIFAIFEINKVHTKTITDIEKMPIEMTNISLVFSVDDKDANKHISGSAYFQAKYYLQFLLSRFNITGLTFIPLKNYILEHDYDKQLVAPYEHNRSAVIVSDGNWMWGVVGEYKSSVIKKLKLPINTAGFEINTKLFTKLESSFNYQEISKFPHITQDITYRVDYNAEFSELEKAINKIGIEQASQKNIRVNTVPIDIFSKDNKFKNITFRLDFYSLERTLTINETNVIMNSITVTIEKELKIKRI